MILSFIVPLYNEEARIRGAVRKIFEFQKKLPAGSEWIFVDDGSTDDTEVIARQELGAMPYRWVKFDSNQGKGAAVRAGILEAKGDFIFFTDADLSTPLDEYEKLLKAMKNSSDLAIGSRALPDSRILLRQSWVRETMGKIFNRIATLLTFKGISDSQCGFKGFRREAAKKLFGLQKIKRFSFDAEIVYLAQRLGLRVAEVPVTWINSPESRVRKIQDSLNMLFDLFRIRWLHRDLE
jgi:dolichyl-phosphate beta-glucosyltransferase